MAEYYDCAGPEAPRSPFDPITISDTHALMAITVGAMLGETPPELYLLQLIDTHSRYLYKALGKDMLRPERELSAEEYKALYAHQQ